MDVKFKYRTSNFDYEKLEIIIKFKEPKKLFKTEIIAWPVQSNRGHGANIESKNKNEYQIYLQKVIDFLSDENSIVEYVTIKIQEYFKEMYINVEILESADKVKKLLSSKMSFEIDLNNK